MQVTKQIELVSPDRIPLGGEVPTDDLIEVYKVCLKLQGICSRRKLGNLSATQAGIPWSLFLLFDFQADRFRFFLNPNYVALSEEKQDFAVRFVNVETDRSRYFIVSRYSQIEYRLQELVIESQPNLVELIGTDQMLGMFVQNECEVLAGRFPHVEGEEYWLRELPLP